MRGLEQLDRQDVAGAAAADREIAWAHAIELADPTPYLSGGELVMTTGINLGADVAAQRAYVRRLSGAGTSALAVDTGTTLRAVPAGVLAAGDEFGIPVLAVPPSTPFIAITEQAFSRLVNEQYALLQRSIAAQERLQRIVLGERGLDAIVAALSTLIGGAVLVFEGRGEPAARRVFRRELTDEAAHALSAELHDRARRGDGRGFAPTHAELAGRALALPISGEGTAAGGLPQAWLVGVKDGGGLTEFDRLILHQAVTVVAFELLRRRVADTTERRLAGDVLSGVISGELGGPELIRRLEPFGLGASVSALVVAGDGSPGTRPALLEGPLAEALRAEAVDGLVASHGQHVCALVPGVEDDELFELAERVVGNLHQATGAAVTAGVGRAAPAAETRRSYHEARCALEARVLGVDEDRRANGNGNGNGNGPAESAPATRVATYRDLGSFQLLLSLQDTDALRLFCESLLAPIEQGEGHYGGELLRSLEAFIEENGQWERAARRLYCHRHTLRYRIRKIEELTGRDLGSARNRIEFWLALRGREIVTTTPSP